MKYPDRIWAEGGFTDSGSGAWVSQPPGEIAVLYKTLYLRADAPEIADLRAEVAELKAQVIAFSAPWASRWAEMFGLPEGHLHPQHYDLLARCGARMDDFTRAELPK